MSLRPTNAFLSHLDAASYAWLERHLIPVKLKPADTICSAGDGVEHVYFPTNALLRLSLSCQSGTSEASLIGNEGAAGAVEACAGGAWTANLVVQIAGEVLKCPAKVYAGLALSSKAFAQAAWRLAALQIDEGRRSAYCQANHSASERLARFVLECVERSGRNPLPITQERLSDMLNIEQATLTACAEDLQRGGVARYSKGRFEILDVERMECAACPCRDLMGHERERFAPYNPLKAETMGASNKVRKIFSGEMTSDYPELKQSI